MAPSILPKPGWAIAHSAHQPLTPLHWTERRKDRKIADVADINQMSIHRNIDAMEI